MRVVIDTNVLFSGLLWRGAPHDLIEAIRSGSVGLASSPALLNELDAVISRAKFNAILERSSTPRERTLSEVRQLAEIISPPPLPAPVCRDPDDDEVLAVAVAAQAELIVSGDDDLLALGSYAGIRIVTPGEAVRIVASANRDG